MCFAGGFLSDSGVLQCRSRVGSIIIAISGRGRKVFGFWRTGRILPVIIDGFLMIEFVASFFLSAICLALSGLFL